MMKCFAAVGSNKLKYIEQEEILKLMAEWEKIKQNAKYRKVKRRTVVNRYYVKVKIPTYTK